MTLQPRVVSAMLLSGAALALSGCGTGQYSAKIEQSAARIRQETEFAEKFYALAPIGGSPFQIQVPRQFPTGADVAVATLPGTTLPGLALAYGADVPDAGGGKYPYYLVLGAVDAAQASAGKVLSANATSQQLETSGEFYKMIQAALPKGTVGAPEPIAAKSPAGQDIPWTKVRATGDMEFAFPTGKTTVPGVFELYVHVENGWVGWFAWRVPTSIEPHSNLAQMAPAMAGTARFQ